MKKTLNVPSPINKISTKEIKRLVQFALQADNTLEFEMKGLDVEIAWNMNLKGVSIEEFLKIYDVLLKQGRVKKPFSKRTYNKLQKLAVIEEL